MYTYKATLESMTRPPETVSGIANVKSASRAASLAVRAVKAAHPGRKASSIVVVLTIGGNDPAQP